MDVGGWRTILASNDVRTSSSDLRNENVLFQTHTMEAFLVCRLIFLDKKAGLRPVVIGEVLRRIVRKVIVLVLKEDVIKCTGMLQVRAGQ